VYTVLAGVSVINAILFPMKNRFLTSIFTFEGGMEDISISIRLINLLFCITVCFIILFLFRKYRKIMTIGLTITVCTLVITGIINCIKIYGEYKPFSLRSAKDLIITDDPVFQFSKTGKNILVIMIDRAISGYVPYIFEEKPELLNSFDGFTWYKNTISFGGNTYFGAPGIYGGYEYTPLEMNARSNVPLVEKHNEALLMLPRIFIDHGFNVAVTDPPWANYSWVPDLSIFDNYPKIKAENIYGKYNQLWVEEKQNKVLYHQGLIKSTLIRFSFFRILPLIFKNIAYDNGNWLKINKTVFFFFLEILPSYKFHCYNALDILSSITRINNYQSNNYNVLFNDLTHGPHFLQAPNYVPVNEVTDRGNGPFADEPAYHVNIAALLLLGKWFDFLIENNVYDNTRIIIVSDHGWPFDIKFSDSIELPGQHKDDHGKYLESFAALLLVKDYNAHGALSVNSTSFMTNADVPLIALEGIIENPVNPWTGNQIKSDKENGIVLSTSYSMPVTERTRTTNKFNMLHVHTNIYDPENWSQVTVQK
jgi:hypothetical protein